MDLSLFISRFSAKNFGAAFVKSLHVRTRWCFLSAHHYQFITPPGSLFWLVLAPSDHPSYFALFTRLIWESPVPALGILLVSFAGAFILVEMATVVLETQSPAGIWGKTGLRGQWTLLGHVTFGRDVYQESSHKKSLEKPCWKKCSWSVILFKASISGSFGPFPGVLQRLTYTQT